MLRRRSSTPSASSTTAGSTASTISRTASCGTPKPRPTSPRTHSSPRGATSATSKKHVFGGWLLRIAHNGALNRKRRTTLAAGRRRAARRDRTRANPARGPVGSLDDPARVAEDAELARCCGSPPSARRTGPRGARPAAAPRPRACRDRRRHRPQPQRRQPLVHRVATARRRHRGARAVARRQPRAQLRAELVAPEVDAFDPTPFASAIKHVAVLRECEERQRTKLSPAAMFSALPIMAIPALKAKAAAALVPKASRWTAPRSDRSTASTDGASRPRGPRAAHPRGIGAATVVVVGAVDRDRRVVARRRQLRLDDGGPPASDRRPTTTTVERRPATCVDDRHDTRHRRRHRPPSCQSDTRRRRAASAGGPVTPTRRRRRRHHRRHDRAPTYRRRGARADDHHARRRVTIRFTLNPKSATVGYSMTEARRDDLELANATTVHVSGTNMDSSATRAKHAGVPGHGDQRVGAACPRARTTTCSRRGAATARSSDDDGDGHDHRSVTTP